jgi:hypothetical protein
MYNGGVSDEEDTVTIQFTFRGYQKVKGYHKNVIMERIQPIQKRLSFANLKL